VLLIALGILAAMSLAMLILIAMCRAGVHFDKAMERAGQDPLESSRTLRARQEMTRRPERRRRPRSTPALRRRHLAAVLPADARR
jgi:hypothetical protein